MSWQVPLSTLPMPEEDVQAVLDCLEQGWLTMGPRTLAFEEALAEYLGAEHVAVVSSGTAALHLACLAVGLGPGDEAIVPGLTFVATAAAVRYAGADPVLCDIRGSSDFNLDPADVEARITSRTKAILPVHFCGYPAPVEELRSLCAGHGLTMIEDTAQAIGAVAAGDGALAGTVGAAGCFSFFSKKQLCVGEGGAVATADPDLAAKVRSLRSHAMTTVTWDRHRGHAESYDVVDVGFNFRIDEPRAALGLSRLGRLRGEIERRRDVAHGYRKRLAGLGGVEVPWTDEDVRRSSHFAFPIVVADRQTRDRLRDVLKDEGVQTTWYPAIHRFSDYRALQPGLSLPRAEEVAERHLCLPMSPTLDADALDLVVGSVERALS